MSSHTTSVAWRELAETIRQSAKADEASVISLIQQLVRIPSRGGLDSYEPIMNLVTNWLREHDLNPRQLLDDSSKAVAVVCDVPAHQNGPRYVLDACLDTAPFGDEGVWRHSPTSATIDAGWLYGRGAADSKAAIAIFSHLAVRLKEQSEYLNSSLTLLFDADEHTGNFGGAKRYFTGPDAPNDVRGVMIGYPGIDQLVIGGRGFLRGILKVRGKAGHTGSRSVNKTSNAIEKAADLVRAFAEHQTPAPVDPILDLSPKLTVTRIDGGESFSIVPDHCDLSIDVRLTTTFDRMAASDLIQTIVKKVDEAWPTTGTTVIDFHETWPAYMLNRTSPLRRALLTAAEKHLPAPVTPKVAGPSNIGNFLAQRGIDATAGLGVRYENLHGTDERIDPSTVAPIQATYHQAVLDLLKE